MATQSFCFCPAACGLAHPRDWCGRKERPSTRLSEQVAFRMMTGGLPYRRAKRKEVLNQLAKFEEIRFLMTTGRASRSEILGELARLERFRFEKNRLLKADVSR